jgi:signal transduction histidine kinase
MAQDAVSATLPPIGYRNLAAGVAVFRVASLVWMIGFNVISGGWQRAWLAYLSFAITAAWTAWLSLRRDEQGRDWVLWLDLALSSYLVVVSAFVVQSQDVVSANRLFFATAYPLSTTLMWGAFRRVRGGLFAALVLSVALALTRPLSGHPYRDLPEFVGLINGSAYYFMAGGTLGAIRRSLDRASRAVQAAVDRVLQEQDRAAQEHTRAAQLTVRLDMRDELHDGVVQDLGLLLRHLRTQIVQHPGDDTLHDLERALNHATARLRDVITRERPELPAGMTSLENWLIDTKHRLPGIDTSISLAAKVQLPTASARELCAAVEQALRNIEQHAKTDTAWIFADMDGNDLQLRVVDRGTGFSYDPDRPAMAGHPGIDGMRRRVEGIGGKMGILSAPGMGTTVEFQLPLDPGWSIA